MSLGLLLGLVALACAAQEQRTTVPFTYNIEYGPKHVGNPDYVKMIADAPPQMLHVGEDIPFSSTFGTKSDYAGVQAKLSKLLTVEEVRAKIAELKKYTDDLHKAGVQWVIPYICNELAFGDHVARTGFFQFFDNWDRYAEFGYPPKPPEDILLAKKFYPFQGVRRAKREEGFYPFRVYTMCTNNPHWRAHILAATANAARCGYDGIFVDVMTIRDYCPHCQRLFREYLAKRYTPAERIRRFGGAELASISLGYYGDGALWFDTQAFWSESNTEVLRIVKQEGRKTNPKFFAVPNLGPFAHFDGVNKRATQGMSPAAWAHATDLFLVEEMQRPGHVMDGYFIHNTLQYKMAFALGYRAGMLLYNAQDAAGVELAMAEAGAGGGGALIQGHYAVPECRRKYRRFFETHKDLWDGCESLADVAVVFDYDQLYWGNKSNLQSIYRLTDYLSENHLLFDFLTPEQVKGPRLARYKAIITPYLRYSSGGVLAELRRYAAGGGVWLDIGESGRFDEAGRLRTGLAGAPVAYSNLDELIPYPRFALYLLKEDDANDIAEIVAMLKATTAGESPIPPSRVKQDLKSVLDARTRTELAVIPKGFQAVRASAYWRNGSRVVAHFLNYNAQMPTQPKGEAQPPKPAENVTVRLRVPKGNVATARLIDPDTAQPRTLSYRQTGNVVEFTLPAVRIYAIVDLRIQP